MTSLDNPRLLNILLQQLIQSSIDNESLISTLMNLRVNKTMKSKIETLLSIISTQTSIDIKTTTKKHRRLHRIDYNVSSNHIRWTMNPYNNVDPLVLHIVDNNVDSWLSHVIASNGSPKTTLTGRVNIDEVDNNRVITASISQQHNMRYTTTELILTKIEEDMYHKNIECAISIESSVSTSRCFYNYIYNINGFIINTEYHSMSILNTILCQGMLLHLMITMMLSI